MFGLKPIRLFLEMRINCVDIIEGQGCLVYNHRRIREFRRERELDVEYLFGVFEAMSGYDMQFVVDQLLNSNAIVMDHVPQLLKDQLQNLLDIERRIDYFG